MADSTNRGGCQSLLVSQRAAEGQPAAWAWEWSRGTCRGGVVELCFCLVFWGVWTVHTHRKGVSTVKFFYTKPNKLGYKALSNGRTT